MTEKKDVVVKVKGLAFNLTNKPEKKDVKPQDLQILEEMVSL